MNTARHTLTDPEHTRAATVLAAVANPRCRFRRHSHDTAATVMARRVTATGTRAWGNVQLV
jgi:hypothetical protein